MLKLLLVAFVATSLGLSTEENGSVQLNSLPYPLQNLKRSGTSVTQTVSDIAILLNDVMTTALIMLSNVVKDVLVFTLNNVVVVFLASILTASVCYFTSTCAYISNVTPFRQIQITIKYMATPDRIMQMADFVYNAIKKYTDMQRELE